MRAAPRSLLLALLALALVALSPTSGRAAPAVARGLAQDVTLVQAATPVGPVARTYTYVVPQTAPAGPLPLVVVLHGRAQSAAAIRSVTGLDRLGEQQGFVTVFPQGYDGVWDAGTCCTGPAGVRLDDVTFLDAVLDDVQERTLVDSTRVYVVGFSNGGMMAYRYACARSTRLAGIAVVSASMALDGAEADAGPLRCRPPHPVSVLAVHGLADRTVPWAGGLVPGRSGGLVAPVRAGVDQFAAAAACRTSRTTRVGTSVRLDYLGCAGGVSARVVALAGLGHTWTRDSVRYGYDTTAGVWGFLAPRVLAP